MDKLLKRLQRDESSSDYEYKKLKRVWRKSYGVEVLYSYEENNVTAIEIQRRQLRDTSQSIYMAFYQR